MNSTATSDGGAQKPGNYVRRDNHCDYDLIATKVCSQISSKWNAMKIMLWPALTGQATSFYFQFQDFFSNLPLQIFIYCVTDQSSITGSWRSVLHFKLSVLTFTDLEQLVELLNEHCASENISTPIYVECHKMYQPKVCVQEFSYFMSGLDNQFEQSVDDSPVCKKIGCRWLNMTSSVQLFLGNWYEAMAYWLM